MAGYDINEHSFRLLKDEPFFGILSRTITKIATDAIPTAGVRVNPESQSFEMVYNPKFFENLGKTDAEGKPITDPKKVLERREIEARGVLKHEYFHLIFEHVTSRLPSEGLSKLWNIAADLAINSEIYQELPYSACVPGRVYTDPKTGQVNDDFKEFPMGMTAEYYFALLKEKHGDDQGEGLPGTLDDHGQWGGEGQDNAGNNIANEIAKEKFKDELQQAAQEAVKQSNGWGKMSAGMQKEILKRLESHIDWRSVLRYFVKTSQKANRQSSIRHINRRYPMVHAGRKVSRTAKVAISIDQSGSVSDKMLELFFAELNTLSEYADFTVIPFDDSVFEEKIFVWKKGTKRPHERVRCGGTNFDAPTDYVNDKRHGEFDGHIVLTDLCAPQPGNSKCQRMWLTTESCLAHNSYINNGEKIIAIPEKELRGEV